MGSSSIPGLGGRPDIDILVGVRRMRDAAACVEGLRRLGYEEPLGGSGTPTGRGFVKKGGTPVSYQLLIVPHAGELWRHIVVSRDYLRAHPLVVQEYHRVKLSASREANRIPAGYLEAERRFLTRIPA